MKNRTVRFEDELYAQIEAAAAADERSLNGEIVWLVKQGLRAQRVPLTHDDQEQGS